MELLAISLKKLDFREIRDSEVGCKLIKDSERIFQDTLSDETHISEENDPRCTIQNKSVSVPSKCVSVDKVGLPFCKIFVLHNFHHINICLCVIIVFATVFQEDARLNLVFYPRFHKIFA